MIKNWFKKIKELISSSGNLTPIAIVTAFLPLVGAVVLLFVGLPIAEWLKQNQVLGSLSFFLVVVILCGISLMPTNAIGILGGFSFGFLWGTAVLILGVTASAVVSYFFHKKISNQSIKKLAAENIKAKAIYDALVDGNKGQVTLTIFLIRLSIITPFALTNFVMSAARVPLIAYIIGTFFGMLPRSAAVAFTGAGLAELSFQNSSSTWMIILGIAATLAVVVVISLISRRALQGLTENDS